MIIQLTESGLFGNAKRAREKSKEAEDRENMILGRYENAMDIYTANNRNNGNGNSGGGSSRESTIINNFTPTIEKNLGTSITIKVVVTTNDDSNVAGYVYLLDGKVKKVSENNIYSYEYLNTSQTYDIEVIAIDKLGNTKKSTKVSETTVNTLISRYLVVDVYDHFTGNGALINELEIYATENQKYDYTLPAAYDSAQRENPAYWGHPTVYGYTNLYDGNYIVDTYSQSTQDATFLLYSSDAGSGKYARFIVDLGSDKNICKVRVSAGGYLPPKSISIYTMQTSNYVSGTDENSTYTKNLVNRSDENLSLLHKQDFESTSNASQWFEFYNAGN